MRVINIEHHGYGTNGKSEVKVYIDDAPGHWAAGNSAYEAIGNLIAHSPEEFGIEIVDNRTSKEKKPPIVTDVSARLLFDKGVWIEYCDESGVNSWCVNEGHADMDTRFGVTEEQIRKWNLI